MLHLQAGVHFEEVEVGFGVDQEFNGAHVLIANLLDAVAGDATHVPSPFVAEQGRRALFDHLLVAALNTALALPQVNDVALPIRGNLDLDVMAALDQSLQIQTTVAKRGLRFQLGQRKHSRQLVGVVGYAHTAAAAAGDGLEHHRVTEVFGRRLERRFNSDQHLLGTRDDWNPGCFHQIARAYFVAKGTNGSWLWSDKSNAHFIAYFRQIGIFGQKPIARMNGI